MDNDLRQAVQELVRQELARLLQVGDEAEFEVADGGLARRRRRRDLFATTDCRLTTCLCRRRDGRFRRTTCVRCRRRRRCVTAARVGRRFSSSGSGTDPGLG